MIRDVQFDDFESKDSLHVVHVAPVHPVEHVQELGPVQAPLTQLGEQTAAMITSENKAFISK